MEPEPPEAWAVQRSLVTMELVFEGSLPKPVPSMLVTVTDE